MTSDEARLPEPPRRNIYQRLRNKTLTLLEEIIETQSGRELIFSHCSGEFELLAYVCVRVLVAGGVKTSKTLLCRYHGS